MEQEELGRIIQRAIQTERDGNRFYMKAADATQDPKAKGMFQQLAKDEVYHISVLEDLYSDLLEKVPQKRAEGFPIFAGRKKIEEGGFDYSNDYEVLQKALTDEKEARDFYRTTAEQVESAQARDLFYDLVEMEDSHVRLIQAEIDFLEKTGFYFDHMEFNVEREKE
jgi:rubrerythrin